MADPVFKKSGVYQKFNLKELFGVVPDAETRAAFGQAVIDRIKERTESGSGIGGAPFKSDSYSDEYADSLEFKAHGKSKSDVNMELSGDMMGLMDIIQESTQTVTIGWADEKENLKAFNHNTGDTVPKRPFFGLSAKEVKEIAKDFKEKLPERVRENRKNGGPDDFTSRALKFLDRLEGNDDDGE